ncbi:MAG: hypothetical protein EAZ07_02730 [Cytophagales bacterium]|nr:MAG: hypothetical protein EAZ07_02730 [Cytophagales bacterium]
MKINKPTKINNEHLSPLQKPENMSLIEWQFALRRQFGQLNAFEVKNIGNQKVYSDFEVFNPESKKTYKVAIRSQDNSLNFCTCNDFKTNGLNTCKHIEYVLYQIKKYPPYQKILLAGYQPDYSSIYLKYGAEREIMIKIGTLEKEKFEALARNYFNKDFTLKQDAYLSIQELVSQAKRISNTFRIYDDALDFILSKRADQHRKELLEKSFEQSTSPEQLTKILKNQPEPYQKAGALFLLKAGKALLADEFPWTNHLQIIIASEFATLILDVKKILILCPGGLVGHWQNLIHSETYSNSQVPSSIYSEADNLARYQIISFEEFFQLSSAIDHLAPDLLIIDQVQRLGNYSKSLFEKIKEIRTKYLIASTNGDINKNPEQLYHQMQLIDIYHLGPRYQFLDNHLVTDKTGATIGFKNLHNIDRLIREIILKRTLNHYPQLLLPQKATNIFISPTKYQFQSYQSLKENILKHLNDFKIYGNLSEIERRKLLTNFTLLRKISCIPNPDNNELGMKIEELKCLIEHLNTLENQKILIYTQWNTIAQKIHKSLDDGNNKIYLIDKNTNPKEKSFHLINLGKPQKSGILITTDQAIEGMNIPVIDILINFDIPLNQEHWEKRAKQASPKPSYLQIFNLLLNKSVEQDILYNYAHSNRFPAIDLNEDELIFQNNEAFSNYIEFINLNIQNTDIPYVVEQTNSYSAVSNPNIAQSNESIQLSFFQNNNTTKTEILKTKSLNKKALASKRQKNYSSTTYPINFDNIQQYLFQDEDNGKWYLKIPLPDIKDIQQVLESWINKQKK